MKNLINNFINPKQEFDNIINSSVNWEKTFLIVIFLFIVNEILKLSYSVDLFVNSEQFSHVSINQVNAYKFILHKMRFYKMIDNTLFFTINYFFLSLLLWLSLHLFNKNVMYINILHVFFICSIPILIGEILNTIVNYLCGFERIVTQYNTLKIGLNIFFNVEKIGYDLYLFLYSINPFQIYSLILLTLGINAIAKIKVFKAFIVALIFTIIKIVTIIKLT